MSVFDFDHYRDFIGHWIEKQPRGGYGQFKKIAVYLQIQTSMLSQVMSGDRELSVEAASALCEYLGLNELESDYFLTLVLYEKAGTERLRQQLKKQLSRVRKQGTEIKNRMPKHVELSESAKATFYSHWYYSGIRLSTAIQGLHSMDALASRLGLPLSLVVKVSEFLVENGLCVMKDDGIHVGPQGTHVASDSPLINRHHSNWRLKAMECFEGLRSDELVFTGPAVISKKDGEKIKAMLLDVIDRWGKVVDQSGSEKLSCLNIDWVDIE